MSSGIFRNALLVLSASVLISACGGGGGGSSSSGGTGAAIDRPVTTSPTDSAPQGNVDPAGGDQGSADAGAPVSRAALLTWDAPTSRTDGSCLSEVTSYRVSYGTAHEFYENVETVDSKNLQCTETAATGACGQKVLRCSYMVDRLSDASWHFAVQAVDSEGLVSDYSNERIRTVQ